KAAVCLSCWGRLRGAVRADQPTCGGTRGGTGMDDLVVVTGAAMGIGRATARTLIGTGVRTVAIDSDAAALKEMSDAAGPLCTSVSGDVSDIESHAAAVRIASKEGRLVGWVNGAGINVSDSAHTLEKEALRRTLEVNLIGTALGCSAAVREFLRGSVPGAIVNVSSLEAVAAFPASFSYEASKGAVEALTRQMAVEYGPAGIRCNCVRPGAVMTPMTQRYVDEASDPERTLRDLAAYSPLGRISTAEEVASIVVFLLGEGASFINGASVPVD